jgi:hypothetical protein
MQHVEIDKHFWIKGLEGKWCEGARHWEIDYSYDRLNEFKANHKRRYYNNVALYHGSNWLNQDFIKQLSKNTYPLEHYHKDKDWSWKCAVFNNLFSTKCQSYDEILQYVKSNSDK